MSVSTSLSQRATERSRTRRRSRLRWTVAAMVVAALLAAAGWLVLGSGALGVEVVRVSGVERLRPADVRARADIRAGTPLARLDAGAVARRVSALAAVRHVEVVRRWPRAVEIRVRERTPAAARARGSGWVLVDRTGLAFATEARRPDGLPLVSAPADAGRRQLRGALDVLDALPGAVRAQVREVRVVSAEQLTVRLTRRRRVVWGSAERGERKAAVLAVLLSRQSRLARSSGRPGSPGRPGTVSVYDVSAPDTPTTRR